MRQRGAPAAVMAAASTRIVSRQVLNDAGCGAKTTALPAATIEIALLMIVAPGFVDGVIAATTPYGAYSTSVNPLSPVNERETRSSTPGVRSAQRRFFGTLSAHRPRPASSAASLASRSASAT